MKNYEDNRRPEDIEHDIERTRQQLSSNIDAIQSKLTPGQMMDQAISYARTSLPADFGNNLNHAIRENPIPVTLMGLGIAWLMMSGRQRPGYMNGSGYHGEVTHRPGSGFASEHGLAFGGQGEGIDDHGVGGHATGDHGGGIHHAAERMSASGHQLKDKAGSMTHDLKDKVSSTSRSLRDKASELSHRFSDSTSSVSDRSHSMAQDARQRANELGQRSQQQYYRAKDNFSHMLEEQPLVLGALGLAVGTLLGAMMPATRREDELMGRTRDDLFARGEQMAKEQAEHLKSSAQRVADTAQQEMQHGSDGAGQRSNGHSYRQEKESVENETGRGSQSLH